MELRSSGWHLIIIMSPLLPPTLKCIYGALDCGSEMTPIQCGFELLPFAEESAEGRRNFRELCSEIALGWRPFQKSGYCYAFPGWGVRSGTGLGRKIIHLESSHQHEIPSTWSVAGWLDSSARRSRMRTGWRRFKIKRIFTHLSSRFLRLLLLLLHVVVGFKSPTVIAMVSINRRA